MVGRRVSMQIASLLALAVMAVGAVVRAADQPDNDLKAEVALLKAKVADLEKKEGENWMNEARVAQIKAIVDETIADAKTRGVLGGGGMEAGYNNGFFIQTSDQNFTLKVNGFFQYRYTFAQNDLHNAKSFPATQSRGGDVNGFDFRYARITFDGNAFSKNITYLFTGDFASDGSNVNDFQLVDGYIAYRFNDLVNVRAGAFITPYSRIIYIASGLEFVDWPTVFNPFNPDRSMGLSVYGDIVKDKLTYEVNTNDGQRSNHLGRADDTSATGALDNRLAFATREAYYGGGAKPADFLDEADLRKDKSSLIWMVGAGADYESANTSSNSFPAKQGSATVAGVSTSPSPGFINAYPLNGDIYRGTIDASTKYQGWAFTGATFFQQINENPGAGITLPPGYTLPGKSSFFQASYYGQVGYMFAPNWEVTARAGQLITEGGPNQMEEYAVGLNYYLFGKNVKIQGDLTYIPNEAAYSSSTFSTVVNTQDIIARAQLQLKF